MRNGKISPGRHLVEYAVPAMDDLNHVTGKLVEDAVSAAKVQLHPLLHGTELDQLERRQEFLQSFKNRLEESIARKLADWLPIVQAVFRFDETMMKNIQEWDGSIHLLLQVPRLSSAVKELGKNLDKNLLNHLQRRHWERFQTRQFVLDIQQITPTEIRYGIGFGAMFFAVHTVPVKVWPPRRP